MKATFSSSLNDALRSALRSQAGHGTHPTPELRSAIESLMWEGNRHPSSAEAILNWLRAILQDVLADCPPPIRLSPTAGRELMTAAFRAYWETKSLSAPASAGRSPLAFRSPASKKG